MAKVLGASPGDKPQPTAGVQVTLPVSPTEELVLSAGARYATMRIRTTGLDAGQLGDGVMFDVRHLRAVSEAMLCLERALPQHILFADRE